METSELSALLEKLSNEVGVSGREREVRRLIQAEVDGLVDRTEVDALGSLFTYKAGTGPEPRLRVLVTAHMDEVGFMIVKIDKSGMLRFRPVGTAEERLLPGKRVVVGDNRVPGVISSPVPHLQTPESARKSLSVDDLYIDIGAADEKAAQAAVRVGDYATFATRFIALHDDPAWPVVRGKAFDDRAGCVALIALLAGQYPVDLVAVFTTQEEVGLRGARAAGYRAAPDAAFSFEGTVCDDRPREPDEDVTPVTRLGDGPAVTIMDRSIVVPPGILRLLRESAEGSAGSPGIPMQWKAPGPSSTEAGAIQLAREGVPACTVSIPCRYIHGPAAILNLNDLANAVRLMSAALKRIDRTYLTRD